MTSLTTFEFPHPSPSPHNVWNSFLWSNVPVGVHQFFQLNSTKMPLFVLTSLEFCFCRQVIHVIIRVHLTNNLIRPYCVTFETTELKLSMKKETYTKIKGLQHVTMVQNKPSSCYIFTIFEKSAFQSCKSLQDYNFHQHTFEKI